MTKTRVKLRIDHPRMQAVVGEITQEAAIRAARKTRDRYRDNIVAAGRDGSGNMRKGVTYKVITGQERMHPRVRVGTPVPYVKYQEYGTRAHGPVRAKALRFKPKGSSTFVFAKWVRGVTPARFARKALDSIRPSDFLP